MVKLKVMNPEINQEIQDLKKELKEIKQLIKALTIATDEGVILNADSLIIKMLKNKIK
jgi:hypothetical protein